MTPQFPFKNKYVITQGYNENNHDYTGGRHGALDIVPFDANGVKFPANIYPVFNGSTVSIQDTSVTRGKGIKERVICDAGLVAYLKEKNLVPKTETGTIKLEILYWHVLEVLDYDGTLTQDTPIAKCGNTGRVFTQGQPVPDDQKGKPPYPGLHLHIEAKLFAANKLLNTGKDVLGRIDPNIIFAYEGTPVPKYFKVNDHGKLGIAILEGFSGTIIFESELTDYETLLKITEGTETALTINIP